MTQQATRTHLLMRKPEVPQQVRRHHGVVEQVRHARGLIHGLDEGAAVDVAPTVRNEDADPTARPRMVHSVVQDAGLSCASLA